MISAVEGLIAELRRVGLPISVSENIDALDALRHVDLVDRDAVKTALGSALVKDSEHEGAYEAVFDLYFGLRGREASQPPGPASGGPGGGAGATGAGGVLDSLDDAGIRNLLLTALGTDDSMLLRPIASIMVSRHAGIQPGRAVAGTYYMVRTMRAVGPDQLLSRLVAEPPVNRAEQVSELDRRLRAEDYERRLARFRQEVEAEIRRRLVADRGADAVARTLRTPLPEDVDFLTASAGQIAELRVIVAPMARKLAARLARKRRHHRRGALDFRRTVRESMSAGGIPVVPVFRRPRPAKPELVILADISGSVSTFAAFTLQLAHALRSEFSKVRSFVFVDGLDEVTRIFEESGNIAEVARRINAEGRGVWLDGRSDYGNALTTFWERYGNELRSRTTVLLLGDARTNYHAPRASAVSQIAGRAGHLYWLNPEPVAAWDSGDSVMHEYATFCDGVFECRNIRQLRAFIEQLG